MNEEKLVGKLVGEKKMEAIIQRLDRLSQDEARRTVAQILKVIHGLVENVKMVMGGEQIHRARRPLGVEYLSL
jgi:VIT1/CCC1 family predicted Fe2+/Mn2+ transporter